ncbi:LacI family DNA-binding transcriptional regulator [Permianibacter aggregans]|uniref:LacI family transcriptional regulator n=1 Tax=Permianibacter aggregans TaxID=1510150 RepID=A0A4R6UVR1_9GAMM|nr:LacI family DNA-binding transcriptional regulator [Permianibacter aggregans]QGX41541.1 LacI family DNA-binding transcriptional regulator [Permianibacter aggregans]TDQ51342.1 LacI family transcriptional regulator [Permianibacter aggregans]
MATIYEVSERAGVSLATVSRVINGTAKVSEKTRQRVMAAMKALNYRPNSAAQSLASNCYNSVGMLVSEVHGPFFGEMMSGVETVLRAAHKHVIIAAGHSDEQSEKEAIEFLRGRSCDALILHADAVSDQYLIDLAKEDDAFVVMNRHIDAIADQCISLDNRHGGYLATKALLEQGHRKIAYIAGPLKKTDAKERLQGHKKALREFDVAFDAALMREGDFESASGAQAMSELLKAGKKFTAVVCGNDEMACGAMNTARDAGLQLPEDLSIIGFDNVIMSRYTFPHLSTIDYPIGEMGRMAAKWVLKNIYQQDDIDIIHHFEPSLILRDSVKAK